VSCICIHVDSRCNTLWSTIHIWLLSIFDKGLLLPRPEIIPFRLTPNMVDALGPCGVDGMYTGALVESMNTLRKNKDTLLSVLEPFLKDPVINLKSSKGSQKSIVVNSAKDSIAKIGGRLDGVYNLKNPNKKKVKRQDGYADTDDDHVNTTQLSVEGQVQKMIMEATSHENLVQVYIGWMPWI
jgi:serine/threonine-protein kinase ATR